MDLIFDVLDSTRLDNDLRMISSFSMTLGQLTLGQMTLTPGLDSQLPTLRMQDG